MKIEINMKIILLLIFLFMFNNISTYLIFLLFILLHEFSHLTVGVIIGGVPKKMTITLLGISLEFYSYGKNKTINKLIFFLIGPLINLFVAIICYKFMKASNMRTLIVNTNFAIGIFNLLPILPLDGGKILKETLKIFCGFEKSNQITICISKIFLIIISLIYSVLIIKIKNIMVLFLLIYLWYLYNVEERKYDLYLKTKSAINQII